MLKNVTAFLLSAVIALTSLQPTAAEAADADDVARLFLGALVVYGIAEAIDDNRKSPKSSNKTVKKKQVGKPGKHRFRGVVPKRLPRHCARTHKLHYGKAHTVFGHRCLQQNFIHVGHLPRHCYQRFHTIKGTRVGWAPRCLRRAGYTW